VALCISKIKKTGEIMAFKCRLNNNDWQKGYDAGRVSDPSTVPPGVEILSWHSGYIEGKAERIHTPFRSAPQKKSLSPSSCNIENYDYLY